MWKCRVKWTIILQEFKEISWNILKKLKQLLKKFCAGKMWMPILMKIYFLLGRLQRKFWGNLEGILQNFDEIFLKSLKKTRSNLKDISIV